MSSDDPSRDTVVDARRTRLGVVERSSDPRDTDLSGTVFGGYLVDSEIGGGAMGVVYRASHIDTNRVVALKTLRARLMDEPNTVARFKREARIASRVGHPHIGSVYELVEAEGRYALALELVEGEPLQSLMTMPLPQERVLMIAAQILRGLEHAHAMGLVHRDLKPDNILVEHRNGRDHARIIDFGIAITTEGSEDSIGRLTGTGQVIGTPAFMAPEQARGADVDGRADLYSLGMIMYEMLAGVLPFAGRPIDVLSQRLSKDAPPIAERVPALIVDPLVELFVLRLLQRKAEKRFANARAALTVVELLLNDRKSAGPALGIMDVEKALAVVSLPPPPSR
ncbi:MAG TPA: serine/threonine-protein kinase [Kofleriaceae bacterium]